MLKPLHQLAQSHYGKSPTGVLSEDSKFPIIGTGGIYGNANRALFQGPAIVVPRKGSLGKPHFSPIPFWPSDTTYAVLPKQNVDAQWLCYSLDLFDLTKLNEATGVPSISRDWLNRIEFETPTYEQQRRIAEILTTVDDAIEQTKALIGKLQQVKAGLMHDLFTRGVTPDGQLRPARTQAPGLYKNSPLGWMPKEWKFLFIGDITESVIDGPFGSNLKTEHYVENSGTRVVRLQNIDAGNYNDSEPVFVSGKHADYLWRNQVIPGDVLVAGLGEESNVVGRACCYPDELSPAVNKADCFRLRSNSKIVMNPYVMHFLNTSVARLQVRRYEQGVTRRRINTGNLKRVQVAVPSLDEQIAILRVLDGASDQIKITAEHLAKLRQQKQGLMQDLLTGRVSVAKLGSGK